MKNLARCTVAAALAACPAALFANGVAVNATAAMQGSFGMEVTFDGATAPAYVQDNSPNAETVYHVSFRANRATFDPGAADSSSFYVLTAREGPDDAATANTIRFYVRRNPADLPNFHARAIALQDDGTWRQVGCGNFGLNDQTYDIVWKAATAPGMNNGVLTCLRNGVAPPSNTNVTMDNDTRRVTSVRFGFFQTLPLSQNANGSYYLDDFISTRTAP